MGELVVSQLISPSACSSVPRRLPIGRLALGTILFSAAGWLELSIEGVASPPATILMVVCMLLSLYMLWSAAAGRPSPLGVHGKHWTLGRTCVVGALVACATITLALAVGLVITNEPSHAYGSDAAAFNHYNAQLVLDGVNPYTADSRFWDAISEFPNAGATPLRRGLYADSQLGPSLTQLVRDVRTEIAHPDRRGAEFDPASLHSYPALAFLVNAPAIGLGFPTTLPIMLLSLVGFLFAAAWRAAKGDRVIVWLVLLGNPLLVLLALRGSFDILALLPALLAWQMLERRRVSPCLLGIACAVKQIVWPLVPFYAIIVWRRDGPREAARRLALAAVAFLVPNAPFVIASPAAWARSMFLPMTLPIFPSGIGLVSLARSGLLPLLPSVVYGAFELIALVALLVWLARAKPTPRPEIALVLGLLPYLLAWHSATTYFAAIPVLAVYAAVAAQKDVSQEFARAGCSEATIPGDGAAVALPPLTTPI
ncbi:MAG TPA: hypothetical protein VF120_15275 [Ktedonobacterales bacterium]